MDMRWHSYYERAADFWRCGELCLYQEKFVGRELFIPLTAPGVILHISVELYLKGFLLVSGFDESELKKLGHDLPRAYSALLALEPDLTGFEQPLSTLQRFGDRQNGGIHPAPGEWSFTDHELFERLGPLVTVLHERLIGRARFRLPHAQVPRQSG